MWVAHVPILSGDVAAKSGFQSLLHKIVETQLCAVGGIKAVGHFIRTHLGAQ